MQIIILTMFYMVISSFSLTPKFCINCKFAINNVNGYYNDESIKCVLFPINDLFDSFDTFKRGSKNSQRGFFCSYLSHGAKKVKKNHHFLS